MIRWRNPDRRKGSRCEVRAVPYRRSAPTSVENYGLVLPVAAWPDALTLTLVRGSAIRFSAHFGLHFHLLSVRVLYTLRAVRLERTAAIIMLAK